MPIPRWNISGVVPPSNLYRHDDPDRSPYRTTLAEFIGRFGTTPERRAILGGLLRFRADLHQLGLVRGFQWLDGSFLENIELLEGRSPRDLDLVTFFELSEGQTERGLAAAAPLLFNRAHVKAQYQIDAFYENLGAPARHLVSRSTYWYSVYGHRRTLMWKGYVQVDLDPVGDAAGAAALLALQPPEGAGA